MDKFCYIPINSLNLNNVLSSESVSPPSFYKDRGYGYKRFELSVLSPFYNSILGYSSIPIGTKYKTDREEYDIYIRIPKKNIKIDREYKVNSEIIFQISQSIYIDWIEYLIIIPNESQRLGLLATTRRSLESKHVPFYAKKMVLLSNEYPVFEWKESYLLNINDISTRNYNSLVQDQAYNKLKGFVYGYTCGKLKEKPSEITESKNDAYYFINILSGIMNELSQLVTTSNRTPNAHLQEDLNHLKYLGDKISLQLDSNQDLNLDNEIKSFFGLNEDLHRHLKMLKYKNSNISIHSILKKFVTKRENELNSVKELIKTLLNNIKKFKNYPSQKFYIQLTSEFEIIQSTIKKKLNEIVQLEISNVETESFPFKISSNSIEINFFLDELSDLDNSYLNIIVKEFLIKTEISTSDEIAQIRKTIIVNVAEQIKKINSNEISFDLDYLRLLHKSLGTVGVGFNPQKTNKKSLQSLAYFLSRYSAIDKLQDYIDKNEFVDLRIIYGIWGAAYGYANLSKLFLEPLDFNKDSRNMLCDYFKNFRADELNRTVDIKDKPIENNIKLEITNSIEQPENTDSQNLFLQKLKGNNKVNKKLDWIEEIMKCHDEIMKRRESISVIFGNEHLINDFKSLLTKSSKNLNQFGKAKVEESTKIFTNYLKEIKKIE